MPTELEEKPAAIAQSSPEDDSIEPAETWEDPGVYLLSAETVEEIANTYRDPEDKPTRLNKTSSIWSALESLGLKIPGYKIERDGYKIPTHVLAQKSWDAALTNALIYAMMPEEERELERKRFRKASEANKSRWVSRVSRLHKPKFRRSIQDDVDRRTFQLEKVEKPPLSKQEIADLKAAVMDKKKLEAYIAHGTDPERVKRIRQLVGYDPEKAARRLERQIEKQEQKKQAAAAAAKKEKKTPNYWFRKFGEPPSHSGRQIDSTARKAAISAVEQMAKYIQTIHLPNNGNADQAVHSLMLVIYNDVEKQYNPKGGRLKAGKKTDVYDLTVVAYDQETLFKIINAVNDQFGERDEHFPRPPCTKHFIHKLDGKSLIESAHAFLDENANKQKRRSRGDVTVCVACNTDLSAASYAQLKDKISSVACTHALCMVCFGQAHVNRSISASQQLHCLCETCNHSSLVWDIVTYDGTSHLDPVEQMIPNGRDIQEDGTRTKRRRTKAEMQEMREENGYVDSAWRRYHPEDFPDYRPRSEIEEHKPQRRKFGDHPLSVGGQVDAVARKARASAIHMIAKFIQTIHFPNNEDEDQPLHSMVLVFYNDVAKQNNAFGGRLSNAKRSDYELTVLAYDNQTCGKIMKALNDQFGWRDTTSNPPPPCTKQFVHKLEGMTMIESVREFMDDFTQRMLPESSKND